RLFVNVHASTPPECSGRASLGSSPHGKIRSGAIRILDTLEKRTAYDNQISRAHTSVGFNYYGRLGDQSPQRGQCYRCGTYAKPGWAGQAVGAYCGANLWPGSGSAGRADG